MSKAAGSSPTEENPQEKNQRSQEGLRHLVETALVDIEGVVGRQDTVLFLEERLPLRLVLQRDEGGCGRHEAGLEASLHEITAPLTRLGRAQLQGPPRSLQGEGLLPQRGRKALPPAFGLFSGHNETPVIVVRQIGQRFLGVRVSQDGRSLHRLRPVRLPRLPRAGERVGHEPAVTVQVGESPGFR